MKDANNLENLLTVPIKNEGRRTIPVIFGMLQKKYELIETLSVEIFENMLEKDAAENALRAEIESRSLTAIYPTGYRFGFNFAKLMKIQISTRPIKSNIYTSNDSGLQSKATGRKLSSSGR